MKLLTAVCLGSLVCVLAPGSGWAQARAVIYELQSGSVIRDECEFCDRVPIERALRGTFAMEQLPAGIGVGSWSISAVDLKSTGDPAEYTVRGGGSYEVAELKTQSMSLKVDVNSTNGIDLESGSVALTVEAPFIDITVTEQKPYRDPNHFFTIRLRAAPQAQMVRYELVTKELDGSIFVDDCLPCARPTIPIPIAGSFLLGKVGEDMLYTYYRLDEIDFVSVRDSFFLHITGSGSYLQGGEVALVQEMGLELKVEETDLTTSGAILASARVPVGATFPEIRIDLEHRNPESDFHVFSLTIVARPAELKPVEFVRSDADGSGETDVSDPIFLLNYLFTGGKAPDCLAAGDVNDDGTLDITDAVYSLSFQFLGGPPPASPYPGCGIEDTADGPGCLSYPPCLPAAGLADKG